MSNTSLTTHVAPIEAGAHVVAAHFVKDALLLALGDGTWRDVVSGRTFEVAGSLAVGELLTGLPVALLVRRTHDPGTVRRVGAATGAAAAVGGR